MHIPTQKELKLESLKFTGDLTHFVKVDKNFSGTYFWKFFKDGGSLLHRLFCYLKGKFCECHQMNEVNTLLEIYRFTFLKCIL